MKKKKLTKKQYKILSIFYSVLALLWVIDAADYVCHYQAIRQVTTYAEVSLVVKMILAVGWVVLAITWFLRYTRYDECDSPNE